MKAGNRDERGRVLVPLSDAGLQVLCEALAFAEKSMRLRAMMNGESLPLQAKQYCDVRKYLHGFMVDGKEPVSKRE